MFFFLKKKHFNFFIIASLRPKVAQVFLTTFCIRQSFTFVKSDGIDPFVMSSVNFLQNSLPLFLYPIILSFKMFNKILHLSLSSDVLQGLIFSSLF